MDELINLNEVIKSHNENHELFTDVHPFTLSLRISVFDSEKAMDAFIKNVEKTVRGSLEYKYWRDYIKDILQIQNCAITEESNTDCTIQIHHHVPPLYLLVKALVSEKLDKEESFCTFDIAMRAIEIHFENKIGYVPLATTIHERVTNNNFEIPIELVHGDYQSFIKDYFKYLDDQDLEILQRRLACRLKDFSSEWKKDFYPGIAVGG